VQTFKKCIIIQYKFNVTNLLKSYEVIVIIMIMFFSDCKLITTLMTSYVVVMAADAVQPTYPQPPPGNIESRERGTSPTIRHACPFSTLRLKKTTQTTFGHKFGICTSIFKFLSPTEIVYASVA